MFEEASIVLSGSSLENKGYGKEIDLTKGPVIRTHDCHWQKEEDHGVRYDYGVLPHPWLNRAIDQIQRVPDKGWLIYGWAHQKNHLKIPPGIRNRKTQYAVWEKTREDFTPQLAPTRGIMSIWLALEVLKIPKVIVWGADSLKTGEITYYYQNAGAPGGNIPNGNRHSYSLESQLIRKYWAKEVEFRP